MIPYTLGVLMTITCDAMTRDSVLDVRLGCQAERIETGGAQGDHMAHALAAGDWNGDGYDDVLAGSLHTDESPGKVWLFLGNPISAAGPACIEFEGIPAAPYYSPGLAFIGDIDGDGGDDIAIGAHAWFDHQLGYRTGRVFIFLSQMEACTSATLTLEEADIIIEAPDTHLAACDQAHFGFSVAHAGDVNGDGFEDLIIGAPGPIKVVNPMADPPDPLVQGEAYVYYGSDPANWVPGAEFLLAETLYGGMTGHEQDRFGWSVAGVGDVDGNGYDDVVVGATWAASKDAATYIPVGTQGGFAHLYLGPNLPVAIEIAPPDVEGIDPMLFGHAIAGGVDYTGEGRPDILIGAPYYSDHDNAQGAVYAYTVSAFGTVVDAFAFQPLTLPTQPGPGGNPPWLDENAHFGWSLATVGQYDPDPLIDPNFNEMAVGAWLAQNEFEGSACPPEFPAQGGRQSGRVFVINVDPQDGDPETAITVQCVYRGEQGAEGGRMRLGTSLAVGDFDGDGLPDIASGGSGFTEAPPATEVGRFYFFINPLVLP